MELLPTQSGQLISDQVSIPSCICQRHIFARQDNCHLSSCSGDGSPHGMEYLNGLVFWIGVCLQHHW